jgi:hypothetical protein
MFKDFPETLPAISPKANPDYVIRAVRVGNTTDVAMIINGRQVGWVNYSDAQMRNLLAVLRRVSGVDG